MKNININDLSLTDLAALKYILEQKIGEQKEKLNVLSGDSYRNEFNVFINMNEHKKLRTINDMIQKYIDKI